jgi:putative ABC transport system permease protein
MVFLEPARMAVTAIMTHKFRSFLTLLGVIIGVTTIIGMMTVIQGLQKKIEEDMNMLATDVFQVQRWDIQMGFDSHDHDRKRPKVTLEEAQAIAAHCPSVENVGPQVRNWGQWIARDKNRTNPNILISGGMPEFAVNNGFNLARGRFITQDDIERARPVIVLGDAIVKKLFPFEDPLDKEVRLQEGRFIVVGILEEMGSTFGESKDTQAVIPFSTFERIYGKGRSISITVKARSPEVFLEAQDEVIGLMRRLRNLKSDEPNNFAIWAPDTLIDQFNQMTKWIKAAAVGICGISLLVAGIGIMNIMLVSVTERTREIGVRRAIGAKKRQILGQFLVEAVLLSEIGGAIGVVLGVTLPIWLGKVLNLPAAVPIWAVVLGLLFCSVVGIVFGLWPAMRAARLDPVEALRYE